MNSSTNSLMPSSKILPVVIGLIIIVPIILLIIIFGVVFSEDLGLSLGSNTKISFGSHYSARCTEITVISEEEPNVIETETYNMEDYVAGVVYAEVGHFWNKEVYKALAVAARTYVLEHASEDCSIVNNSTRQKFEDITERPNGSAIMAYEAVQETEGQVLYKGDSLYSVQYDAFCFEEKNSSYYILSQQHHQIPTNWVESNVPSPYKDCRCQLNDPTITACYDENNNWTDGGHGNGLSQYGSLYLVEELGYTYEEVLAFYYGEDVSIATSSFITSIAGLEIKDTTNANNLNKPITSFLETNNSSLDNMNEFIHNSVSDAGVGTREGVVTAAVSLINYLYDNYNSKLPYWWGGGSDTVGIPSSFGTTQFSAASRGSGTIYSIRSFDCSGFVSWAIKNGGYKFTRISTDIFDARFSKNSCNITESTCIGQPGDLINSKSNHVQLIIAVDEENGKYFIAESTSYNSYGVIMRQRDMHSKFNGQYSTKIIHMDDFYNNSENVDLNY